MVRYHAPSGAMYARWFHQFDPYYEGGGEKTLTFRWSETDQLSPQRAGALVADARARPADQALRGKPASQLAVRS
jgi:hypothetical protein